MGVQSQVATKRDALAVERSRPFLWAVRAGFVTRSVTYGVVGGIALALAVGAGAAPAAPDQQGALALIARAPLGRIALAVAAIGLLAYAVWKLGQAAFGHGPEGGGDPELKDRVANAAGGIVYLAFFAVAVQILFGSSSGGSSGPSLPEMSQLEYRSFMILGRAGLTARAIVFGLVGYFVIKTAIDFNPREAVGLDGALARVHHQPFGSWLLGLAAAGLIVFAAYSLLEGRFRRL